MKKLSQNAFVFTLGFLLLLNTNYLYSNSETTPVKKSTINSIDAAGDTLNLALKATVSTSYVSSWEKLAAVKDGISSTSSRTKPSAGAYGNWNGESAYGNYNWVQFEWPKAHKILSTEVYWWIDNTTTPPSGISKPTDAFIEYWNGAVWVKVGNIGLELNKFNSLNIGIMTNKLRISMKSGSATGIIEWKATGVESGDCPPTPITTYVKSNGGDLVQNNTAIVQTGDSVYFGIQAIEGGNVGWTGPDNFLASSKSVSIKNLQTNQSGTYKVCYINTCGALSYGMFHLTVRDSAVNENSAYTWSTYNHSMKYNFKDEYPDMTAPTKELGDCPEAVGTISSGWWSFKWGSKANALIDSASVMPMLNRLNKDFAYFRDTLGWPPDKRAKRGYRSTVFLYGSGLSTDNASNTDLGGWQSSTNFKGENWPMVLISYYPVYCFNPKCTYRDITYQTDAVVHEGIHSVLADLPGAKDADWFQEGGNTWLQQEAEVRKTNNYSQMGYLNVASLIAPFMPIECYRGWLLDGSFGGPGMEGIDVYINSSKVCNWRNLLGGVQYSNVFPTFLGMTLGSGSIAWIWRNCESRVLEGMSKNLGDLQLRRLLSEYRAKQAVLDMGKWTNTMKKMISSYMGTSIKAEETPNWINVATWYATPYVKTTKSADGLLTPEARTLPGWSGANQIPLVVSGDEIKVKFLPLGQNMTCQLCYRTKTGQIVYSQIVNGGECALKLDLKPANNVVFAVITNTDYVYEGDTTRKSHFDYRLQLVKGVTGTADVTKKWFDWTLTLVSLDDDIFAEEKKVLTVYPNPVERNQPLNICFSQVPVKPVLIEIRNLNGQLVYQNRINGNETIQTGEILKQGVYLISAEVDGSRQNNKLIVR